MTFKRFVPIGCALLVLALTSCSITEPSAGEQQPKRPVAGDTVTPVILLGNTWEQKGPVLISARLEVQGKGELGQRLLELKEVPYEIVPHVTLAFFAGTQELQKLENVALLRDC
jgi:hypothetical protein